MKLRFTAIIQRGESFFVATCPEVPEAHGQGENEDGAVRDLEDSIESILDYRREEAFAKLAAGTERRELQMA